MTTRAARVPGGLLGTLVVVNSKMQEWRKKGISGISVGAKWAYDHHRCSGEVDGSCGAHGRNNLKLQKWREKRISGVFAGAKFDYDHTNVTSGEGDCEGRMVWQFKVAGISGKKYLGGFPEYWASTSFARGRRDKNFILIKPRNCWKRVEKKKLFSGTQEE